MLGICLCSPRVGSAQSWQLGADVPRGGRDRPVHGGRAASVLSASVPSVASSAHTPLAAPAPGPLYVDPAPRGLTALWPFTCDCVQSPCSPPSEPRESVPISNQLPKTGRGGGGDTSKTLLLHHRSSFFFANRENVTQVKSSKVEFALKIHKCLVTFIHGARLSPESR